MTEQARAYVVSATATNKAVERSVKLCPTCGRTLSKTHAQRNEFHRLCRAIGKEIGDTPGHIKEAIKGDFYGIDEYKIGNKWYRRIKPSESSDRKEYSELIEYTHQWAAENLGLVLK